MKHRVELFTDGVFAIIVTLLVLDLHPPARPGLAAWLGQIPELAAYFLAFLLLGGLWQVTLSNFSKFRDFTSGMIWLALFALAASALSPLMLKNLVEHQDDPSALLLYLMSNVLGLIPLKVMRATADISNILDPQGWPAFCRTRDHMAGVVWLLVAVSAALGYLHVWIGFVVYCLGMTVFIVYSARRNVAERRPARDGSPLDVVLTENAEPDRRP